MGSKLGAIARKEPSDGVRERSDGRGAAQSQSRKKLGTKADGDTRTSCSRDDGVRGGNSGGCGIERMADATVSVQELDRFVHVLRS